jgi:hypothetical protein
MYKDKHALLAPSAAARWCNCPQSARLTERMETPETDAAHRGTALHALAECELKKALGLKAPKTPFPLEFSDEERALVAEYVDFAVNLAEDADWVAVEKRVSLGKYVPESFGTVDFACTHKSILCVVDFKTGYNPVAAAENPQLRLYALGLLRKENHRIRTTIWQPGHVNTEDLWDSALRKWANTYIKPRALLAHQGGGGFLPGVWCKYCAAKPRCRACLAEAEHTGALLGKREIGELLPKIGTILDWAKGFNDYATRLAADTGEVPRGYRLGATQTKRVFSDPAAAAKAAEEAGFKLREEGVLSVARAERLLGSRFEEVLGAYVTRPKGAPKLIPLDESEDFSD